MTYYESRMRRHIMSHELEDIWVTNEKTQNESRIPRYTTCCESRMRGHTWRVVSHEWEDISWVTNDKSHHESRITRHITIHMPRVMNKKILSATNKKMWWVTNKLPAQEWWQNQQLRFICIPSRTTQYITRHKTRVTNEEIYNEPQSKKIWWVTNESPAIRNKTQDTSHEWEDI